MNHHHRYMEKDATISWTTSLFAYLIDPKTWLMILAVVFAAGSAVAVMEQSRREHDARTERVEQKLSQHVFTMEESFKILIREAESSRQLHEDQLRVLQIMCVRQARTEDARTECVTTRR